MVRDNTIEYYNANADAYFQKTVNADMRETISRFAKYVNPGGSVVDIGAGSGRDMKLFREMGFAVEGIDASEKLCNLARVYADCRVECVRIQEWNPEKRFDGVWANASLVHLTEAEIEAFLIRLPELLNETGVAYMSFKSGIKNGYDPEGRFFTNYSEEKVQQILKKSTAISIIESWKTADVLSRNDLYWINIILQKCSK